VPVGYAERVATAHSALAGCLALLAVSITGCPDSPADKVGVSAAPAGSARASSTAGVELSADPTSTASAVASATGAAPAPSASSARDALRAGLKRSTRWDQECSKGQLAFTDSTKVPMPKAAECDGPKLVHYTMRDPKTGEERDGESPVFCCTP